MNARLAKLKNKMRDNLPVILTSVAAISSAVVVVYYNRKISVQVNDIFSEFGPKKYDFSLYLSGKEMDKIKSGIPRISDMGDVKLYIVTKNMLTSEAQESIPKVLFREALN